MIEALTALRGRRFEPVTGPDVVEASALRRMGEALEWELDHVPAAAHAAFALPAYWRPGDPTRVPGTPPQLPVIPWLDAIPAELLTFNLGLTRKPFAAVALGDRLSCEYEVVAVTPKTLRVGAGAILDIAARYRNQRGELVSVATFHMFSYVPAGSEPAAPRPPADPGAAARAELVYGHTFQRLIMWSSANRDFSYWHHDRDVSRACGAPDAFANTYLIEGLYERLIASITGRTDAIRTLEFRLDSYLLADTTVRVTATWDTPEEITLRQVADGRVTSTGRAVLRT